MTLTHHKTCLFCHFMRCLGFCVWATPAVLLQHCISKGCHCTKMLWRSLSKTFGDVLEFVFSRCSLQLQSKGSFADFFLHLFASSTRIFILIDSWYMKRCFVNLIELCRRYPEMNQRLCLFVQYGLQLSNYL